MIIMNKSRTILLILMGSLIFLVGFLSCYLYNSLYVGYETPFVMGIDSDEYPGNWINQKDIKVYDDKVVIYIDDASLSKYADTGSMLPVLGADSNGIRVKPENPEQIQVGDIISFEKSDKLIVHRVVAKGVDEKGDYFITKGDNNTNTDGKVYFNQVRYVTVVMIY